MALFTEKLIGDNMMKMRIKRGLTAAFQIHTINAVVHPTGCVVKDRYGQRWQRMRVRIGRASPDHDWFRIEASRADIKHQLENRVFDANSRYAPHLSRRFRCAHAPRSRSVSRVC